MISPACGSSRAARIASGHGWTWCPAPDELHLDLGDLRLGTGRALHVSVTDEHAAPLAARWIFEVESEGLASVQRSVQRHVEYACEAPCSAATLRGLPLGRAVVRWRHAAVELASEAEVHIAAGETSKAVLVCKPKGLDRGLYVRTRCRYALKEHEWQPARVTLVGPDGTRVQREMASVDGPGLAFDGLPFAPHVLRVEHPCFATYERDEVFPAATYLVELSGSAELEVEVRDPDARPVEAYALALRYPPANRALGGIVRRRELGEPLPRGSIFDGIVPGEIAAIVRAPGYAPAETLLGDVQEHERCAIEVELVRGSAIFGVLRDELGNAITRGNIVLSRRRDDGSMASHPSRVETPQAIGDRNMHAVDGAGCFRFEELQAGSYWIAAQVGEFAGAKSDVELVAGETREIELVLRQSAPFDGQLVGSPDLPLGLAVLAYGLDELATVLSLQGRAPRSRVDGEGRFRFDSLPVGRYRFVLVLTPDVRSKARASSGGAFVEHEVELGIASVHGSQSEAHRFDLAQLGFGSLEVDLLWNGAVPQNCVLILRAKRQGSAEVGIVASLSASGRARFDLVPSGSYCLNIDTPGIVNYEHAELVSVASGATSHLSLALTPCAGTVRILDRRTGAPRARASLSIGDPPFRRPVTTDAQGDLVLELAPSTYTLWFREDGELRKRHTGETAVLHWTASGPLETEMRF